MAERKGGLLSRVRQVINHIWERCRTTGFVARGYSRGEVTSPIPGSNITLYDGGREIVVIWQENESGPIVTITFVKSNKPGQLEQEIRAELLHHNLIN